MYELNSADLTAILNVFQLSENSAPSKNQNLAQLAQENQVNTIFQVTKGVKVIICMLSTTYH